MKNRSLKINIWSVIFFIMLLPSLLPTYLWGISSMALLCKFIRYGTIPFIICIYILTKQKISKVLILLCMYVICIGISTKLSPTGEMSLYISSAISALNIILLCELAMKKKPKTFIQSILFMLECWIFINFITIVLFPNGLYQAGAYSSNYFLGYDNTHIRVQLLALNISYIYSFMSNKKISYRTIFLYSIVLLSNLLVFSVTAIIATVIWGIGVLCIILNSRNCFKKLYKLFTVKTSLIVGMIGSLIIVAMSAQTAFSYLIENVFKKDMTLSGRTFIWSNAISAIENRPIWGFGYELADTISMRLVRQIGFGTSPHNFYLEVLYQGGLVLFLIIMMIYLCINKDVKKYNNSSLAYVMGLWMMIIAIMGIVEPQLNINLIITWIIVSNIDSIFKLRKNKYNS